MRRAHALLGFLAVGAAICIAPQSALATNTRMVGFGLASAYQPGSCSFCHGQAVDGSPVGQYWPAAAPGSYPNRSADHPQHIAAMSQARYQETTADLVTDTAKGTAHDKQIALCLACHPDPGQPRAGTGESSHAVNADPAGTADVHGDGRTPSTASTFRTIRKEADPSLVGIEQVVQGTYDNSAAAGGKKCSNVDCHYRTVTPTTGAAPDGWFNAAAVVGCSSCHAWNPYTLGNLPNAHDKHAAAFADGGYNLNGGTFGCFQCHPTIVGGNNGHQDGDVDLTFTGVLDPGGTRTEVYSLGTDRPVKYGGTDSAQFGTCTAFYCHGNFTGGVIANAPNWYNTDALTPLVPNDGDGRCGTCHDTGTFDATPETSISTGNHPAHLTEAYGPNWGVASAAACQNCHTAGAPNATHVDGTVTFDNVAADPASSRLGAQAVTVPTADETDRCTHCHSTWDPDGAGAQLSGTAAAKQNWANGTYKLDCLTCHNTADPATRNADGTGVLAPAKDANWATRGHGLAAASTYPWTPNRSGAEAACSACHSTTAAHLSGALSDTDRLVTAGNALCHSCHDGTGTGIKAQTRVSTHGNRSTTMSYTAKRNAFELNCVECHDVHGSANAYMVNTVNADGPLVPVRYYNNVENDLTNFLLGGTVSFTANNPTGPDYASLAVSGDVSKICQTCHTATSFYNRTSGAGGHPNTDCLLCHKHAYDDDFGPGSQDGFMPAGCNGCHGYPPIRPSDVPRLALPGVNNCTDLAASSSDYRCENYVSGGGFHWAHVEALKKRFPASTDARELCGPCHGDGAGSADHNGSNNGPGDWLISARGFVNIRAKASGQSSWGEGGTYNGAAVTAVGTTALAAAMTEDNSRCAALDCHGQPTVVENLNWFTAVADGADPSDGLAKSQACKGCHDQTPSQWRVYSGGGSPVYTGNASNTAANYYGTVSGYSRGGHGDAGIQDEDPFVNSASGTTPVDCTACHLAAAAHFPAAAGNLHRLQNITIENTSGSGLCNECHPRATYPGNHHPSLQGTSKNPNRDIVVNAASQPVRQAPTTWFENPPGSDHWEQDGYSASGVSGNPDFFVDWWNGPGTPPRPQPLAVLPLIQFVGNQSGPTNTVICVTCHNPHGTDLYVFDPGGIGGSIPDNNMLRLRDEDNTLCNACHKNLP